MYHNQAASQCISKCNAIGVGLYDVGDKIVASNVSRLPLDLREEIKREKPGVLNLLRERSAAANRRVLALPEARNIKRVFEQFGLWMAFSGSSCYVLFPIGGPYRLYHQRNIFFIEVEIYRLLRVAFCRRMNVKVLWPKDDAIEQTARKCALNFNTSKAGYVYLLGTPDGYCKIGRAKVLNKRISQIKLQLPFRVSIIHSIHVTNAVWAESYLHRKFRSRRLNGEWFQLTKEDIAWIKGLTRLEDGELPI